jgi:Glycosyl transferase family 2
MTLLALAVLGLAVAVASVVATNLVVFRRAPAAPERSRPVSILLPVRNEADGVEAAVRAACAQTAPGEVVVLDDQSTDATPAILARLERELPRLRVVRGRPLPSGWAGKAWACWQLGAEHARHDWLMFVDCDVRLTPDAAARALALARAQDAAFVSAFPRQLTLTTGEALVVPLIHLVLLAWLPLWLVRRVALPSLVAGCGQLMLVARGAYLAADGHRAIRATLHDGLMLARRMKATGVSVGVFDGRDIATCRMYAGFTATWRGFARNAYEALGSPSALATMVVLNGAVFVLPFAALPWTLANGEAGIAAAAWGAAAGIALAIRGALARRFGAPAWTMLATPLAVTLMLAIQVHSYVNTVRGRPVTWRARIYTEKG